MSAVSPSQMSPARREQFRMRRLQVFNWGTFSGLHDIPIAERGFLFVGRSGSGKSTLLDAFTALLIPPKWAEFNAAARDSERSTRERNFVSYVRGAWAEQTDDESGEIAKRYLRSGTTWSALALTFHNELGQTVVLAHLLWLRGSSSSSADVRHHYLIFERSFDLREIEDFDLDIRKLKHKLPDVFERPEFRPYGERFRRLLGIEDEMALRLLHKTQSAKSLGDLNTFLRDFMLERPETFEVADRLVAEFGELNAAHQAVVTARDQIRTLAPARAEYERIQEIHRERLSVQELQVGLDLYREHRRISLLEEAVQSLEVKREGSRSEADRCKRLLDDREEVLRDLQRQHNELGGERIEHWEKEIGSLKELKSDRLRKRDQAQEACRNLGRVLPDSPQAFAELVGEARREIESSGQYRERAEEQRDSLTLRRNEAQTTLVKVAREVEAMRRQPSNIPAHMLDLRDKIARALHLPEAALPFVGELIEVRLDEAPWRGAIERLLRGFALSIVVEERHYAALSSYVNSTHLDGQRLIYYRMLPQSSKSGRPLAANSLVYKLTIKEGPSADWLRGELSSRFDYACVESLQAFRSAERALTREGQIRHGPSRHEKDDRRLVDDRRSWVLGFDNRERRALFEEQATELHARLDEVNRQLDDLKAAGEERARRDRYCVTLSNLQWNEIDVAFILDRIAHLERQIQEAREGNPALDEVGRRIAEQQEAIKQARKGYLSAEASVTTTTQQLDEHREKLCKLREDPAITDPTPRQREGLDIRFAEATDALTLDNLEEVSRKVERRLGKALDTLKDEHNDLAKSIESRFANFKSTWKMEAGDQDTTLASAPEYFAKLQRLETDNLPAYEQRFFELLQNQSHQNLAALSQHLRLARSTILDRLTLVNDSLSRAPFNPGTFLRIDHADRQLEDVREFKQDLERVLDYAWTDDRDRAEERFLVLQKLVERLGSAEPELRRWRESVLDVRQHMEFIGREVDAQGIEIEVYRSGAGKSGGQRQKLATTCLAAALCYQLGGNESGVPMYGPVVLDEAFDKADNEFTTLAMNIFVNFGFQMIVATPLKSVMTLEPFIGGACFVDIADRCRSGVLLIEYDNDRQRLKLPESTREHVATAIS